MLFKRDTFLQYVIIDALESGSRQNIESIQTNLKQLMSIGEIDLLMMTKFLGINDFLNLDLLDPIELVNDFVDLSELSKCYDGLTINQNAHQEFDSAKSKSLYIAPSPCFDKMAYSECKKYCDWQQKMFQNFTSSKINSLGRYVRAP